MAAVQEWWINNSRCTHNRWINNSRCTHKGWIKFSSSTKCQCKTTARWWCSLALKVKTCNSFQLRTTKSGNWCPSSHKKRRRSGVWPSGKINACDTHQAACAWTLCIAWRHFWWSSCSSLSSPIFGSHINNWLMMRILKLKQRRNILLVSVKTTQIIKLVMIIARKKMILWIRMQRTR